MPPKLRLAYFVHSLRSDWNNGNAHFLRGLLRAMVALDHEVTIFEPASGWSIDNLRSERAGEHALREFERTYPDLNVKIYDALDAAALGLREILREMDVVILHEWNPPELAQALLVLRDDLGYRLLFHDTHHRASSDPLQMERFGVSRFDAVLAFGEALRQIYLERFDVKHVWTLHEAADATVFYPRTAPEKTCDVLWVGNWGEGERASEIEEFLLKPAARLQASTRFQVHGVRYPEEGLDALRASGVAYRGYLPNLEAPRAYAAAAVTVHIPRQQYTSVMTGIPTIRVFEALASGIPLISAPWQDVERLFRPGDFKVANDAIEMAESIASLLADPDAAAEQAACGLQSVLSRHTCLHRAKQLTQICGELLQ